jgi:hypothetical protein
VTRALARLDELRDRVPEVVLVLFVIVAGVVVGTVGVRSFKQGALVVSMLVVVLLVSRRPVVLGIVAVAGVYGVQRLGSTTAAPGSAGGIAYTDALLTAAAILALPALASTPELRRLRGAAYAIAVYLALLLPGVVANPSPHAYLEWAHRLVMVGGSLLVGAWLVRERAERTALRLLALVSCVIAVNAIQWTFTHGFDPASPHGWNKNFLGALLAAVFVLVLAAPDELQLPAPVRFGAVVLVAGGLLSSQSRGAILAAVLGMLVAFVVNPAAHNLRVWAFAGLVGIALVAFTVISIHRQLTVDQSDLNNSSLGVRFNVEHVTLKIWRTSPFVGVGLKYFFTGHFGPYAFVPNNIIDNELAESGVIGLLGFVLFQIGVIVTAARHRGSPLVAAALGIVAGKLLHGMVDIYWSAGVAALPFLILGIALAQPRAAPPAAGPRSRIAIGAHLPG